MTTSGAPGAGRLLVLSGPSGVGKGSVVAAILRLRPDVWRSVSVTTRAPRPGEVDGEDYVFVDDDTFARMVADGELLEHATYARHSYGTPSGPVTERLARSAPTLLEIELQGARQVRAALGADALLAFLAPPSWEELERRLAGRGTEDPARVAERLAVAREELAAQHEFDVVVVNDDVERAAGALLALWLPTA
ncbi:MAG TPA: guanylate kinase [Mycobacteriales bacterium]|nr:guanylate kinase [Mycobacteriales bacterium]